MGITQALHGKGVAALWNNSFTRVFIFVIAIALLVAFFFIVISNAFVKHKNRAKKSKRLSIIEIQELVKAKAKSDKIAKAKAERKNLAKAKAKSKKEGVKK